MRILLVFHDLSFRGGEKVFANLAKGLTQQKHSAALLVARKAANSIPLPPKVKLITPSFICNQLFQNNWIFTLFSLPVTTLNLLNHAKNYDVIYTSESFLSLWPAVLIAKLTHKKLILSVFELGHTSENHPALRGLSSQIFSTLNTYFVKQVQHAITVNQSLEIPLKQKYQIPHITTILAGIDFDLFKNPEPKKIKQKYRLQHKKIIVMTGIVHPYKKQDLALDILKEVRKKIPEIMLLIIGDGPEKFRTLIKQKIQQENLKKNVVLVGLIKDEELKNFYAAADMVLQCGPIGGLTIIEAIISGKMPIYPTSGNPPQGPVEPLQLGIIVAKNQPEIYAKKIIEYLKNPQKYKDKLHRDQHIIRTKYSLEKFAKETIKILTEKS
jgi:glycosyltransferase involved in cell wall biosynthesis